MKYLRYYTDMCYLNLLAPILTDRVRAIDIMPHPDSKDNKFLEFSLAFNGEAQRAEAEKYDGH